MNAIPDWLRGWSASRRNSYYFGKMMGVAQFEQEQRYALAQRWMINRLSLGTGILCGLDADQSADASKIVIKPGVAIDPLGREIVVPHTVTFDPFVDRADCGCAGPSGPPVPGQQYFLCLRYHECETDFARMPHEADCNPQPDCAAGTIVETYCLGLSSSCGPSITELSCEDLQKGLSFGEAGAEAGTPTSPPPTLDKIRTLLLSLVKGTRQPVGDEVGVPLGKATIGADGKTVTFDLDGRQYLYSQAEIMKVLLAVTECVARCCGADHPPVDPTPVETLRITGIKYLFSPRGVEPENLTDIEGTEFLVAADDSDDKRLIGFHVAFNQPVDGGSIKTGVSITTGGNIVPFSFRMDQDAMGVTVRLDLVNIGPGAYEVALLGDEQNGIRTSSADGTPAQFLNGEPNFTSGSTTKLDWPSGQGPQHGNFTWTFTCELPRLNVKSMAMTAPGAAPTPIVEMGPGPITFRGDNVSVEIKFSRPIDSVAHNEIGLSPPTGASASLDPLTPSDTYQIRLAGTPGSRQTLILRGNPSTAVPPTWTPIQSFPTFAGEHLAFDGELNRDVNGKIVFPSGGKGIVGGDFRLVFEHL